MLLYNLQHKFRLEYDSTDVNNFIAHWQYGITWTFETTAKGLYASQVQTKMFIPSEAQLL